MRLFGRRVRDSPEALTCRELVRLVTDYLEDELPPADRRRFEAHLAACDGCTTYVEQMRSTISVAAVLAEDSVRPEARDALLAAFRTWDERRR